MRASCNRGIDLTVTRHGGLFLPACLVWICVFPGWLASPLFAQGRLTGRILDESGKPVASVRVVVIFADGKTTRVRPTDSGEFQIELDGTLPASLRALSPGYALYEQELNETSDQELVVTLHPSLLADSVTVVASRSRLPMTRSTQSVLVLGREQQQMSPAVTLDDYLRRVPGFALFRRSSSLVAHPTSQGVSMRGVGPSGASRSLVMADSIPLNDPFGGWVYWSRVPRIALDRVEMLRGGASELYGTDALGGVIRLFRRTPESKTLEVEGYMGNFESADTAFYASHRIGRHGFALTGEAFRTEGYVQVPAPERGSVDVAARSRHHSLEGFWEFKPEADKGIYALVTEFSERRGNGTPLQVNDTQIRAAAAGATFVTGQNNHWSVDTFSLLETFDASFTAVALNRNSESLTRTQRVPAKSAGALASWRRLVFGKHLLLAGAEYSLVKGASDELLFGGGTPTGSVRADGRQDRTGIYFQDLFQTASRLQIVFGARWDGWHNHDAFTFSRTFATGAARQTPFPSRKQSSWSPKLGVRWDLSNDL